MDSSKMIDEWWYDMNWIKCESRTLVLAGFRSMDRLAVVFETLIKLDSNCDENVSLSGVNNTK